MNRSEACGLGKSSGVLCVATIRKCPSRVKILPKLASQMRAAFSSMASNTGSKIARRATNDLKDFRRGRLLL